MVEEFKFKCSMSLGSGTAENDGEFLEKCFVETPEFESLLDYSDRKLILLGRTGSGKTALLRMAKERVDKQEEFYDRIESTHQQCKGSK